MTAIVIEEGWQDHLGGRRYRRWDVDPILAIGGCKHGELLPKTRSAYGDLMVHKPMELSAHLTDDPPEPTAMADLTERYQRQKFIVRSRRDRTDHVFPVYVAARMSLDEAQVWMELVLSWNRLWMTIGLALRLSYLRELEEEELDRFVEEKAWWAKLQHELLKLRDKLEGL